jgi:hypothetical protein
MANLDSVAQNTAVNFGNFALVSVNQVSLNSTGNAVVSLPILLGGLTVGGSTSSSGQVILRRITVQNANANVALGNVSILTTNDGNTSNAVVAATLLSNLTAVDKFQDLTIASPYAASTTINGYNTQSLYVKVNTAVANATVDIRIYGDTVSG